MSCIILSLFRNTGELIFFIITVIFIVIVLGVNRL